MIRSCVSCVFILAVFVVLETALLSNIVFLPAFPDFVMICVLYFSVRNGKTFGEITGFIGGLFLDFLSGAPFGTGCVIRVILGYLGGLFHNSMNYQSVFVSIVAGFFATLAKALLVYANSFLFPNCTNHYHIFSSIFALELALNTIFTPLLFKILSFFDDFIVAEKRRF